MSAERFAADGEQLRRHGARIARIEDRATRLAAQIEQLTGRYPNAGGDGDFRASFDTGYLPAAQASTAFTSSLAGAVDALASDTVTAAETFSDVDADTSAAARRRR
ncbi:hypothetical protein [Mycetocola reblochoni]|uniref:hypothetical protein n=1 Tax=Mycetocola reblochoni TaxID=331618 RepID=UPI000B35B1A8|nr:hypothetical protein [Mycetocola reblochoni]